MKNPLRYSKLFVNAMLLLTTPALIAYPQSDVLTIPSHSFFAGKGAVMQQLLTDDGLLSYDAVLRFLDEIENGDLEEAVLSTEEWDTIKNFLAFLAMEGTMPDASQEEKDAMERDIKELFNPNINSNNEENESFAKTVYFPYQMGKYTIVPAVFYGQRDIVLCKKSWIAKQWKHCKKFVKNHKKEVIIGAVLIVAAVAVVVTAVAATTAAAGAATAMAAARDSKESAHKESKEVIPDPIFQSTVEDQASSLKDTVAQNNLLPVISSNENNGENARIVGSALAHETIGSVSNSSSMPYLYGDTGNYERAIIAGHGKIDKAFSTEEAGHYINREAFDDSMVSLQENIYQSQGEQSLKQGRYEQAVCDFEKAIEVNPYNHDLYLAKAYSYFENGEYDRALIDYRTYASQESKSSQTSIGWSDAFDMSVGFAGGFKRGAVESGHQLVSFASDFVYHPITTTCNVCEAFSSLAKLTYTQEWKTLSQALAPEVCQLINEWDRLSAKEKAERVGYVSGKYGGDILIPGAAAKILSKGVKGAKEIYLVTKNLEIAERTLVLEGSFSQLVGDSNKFTEIAAQTSEHSTGSVKEMTTFHNVEEILMKEGTLESFQKFQKAEEFLKPYRSQYLSENQARGLIQQAGVQTFPRPKGIPDNFRVKISKEGAGMKYIHPEHNHTSIRVMPGKPHSPNPSQQKPYVVHIRDGKHLDKYGNIVEGECPESHIPLQEFIYRSN